MITFCTGILILILGYLFYSKYIEKLFEPDERKTPAHILEDGVDYIPMAKKRNALIQLLNIAGLGPIIGALQGILFGPVAFLLIPLGAVFMGSVHDYSCGMISVRNNGVQGTELVKKYLGKNAYKISVFLFSLMLLVVATVFVYMSGDIIAQRFFHQTDFSLANPVVISIYIVIASYYILATLFPIDKIIGKIYPFFALLLLLGTGLVFAGFFTHGIKLAELDITHLNLHPNHMAIIPFFFMTVSCGLLSGFHSTQATIVSRTLSSEKDGRKVFYGMMTLESLIAMIWAAAGMHVYNNEIINPAFIGNANAINAVADIFVPYALTFIVTAAVVVLPITSGDTALRGLRITIADLINLNQKPIKNRLIVIFPLALGMIALLTWAKLNSDSFGLIWRYFNFLNQLITIPTFFYATVYLKNAGKNYFVTLIPGLLYVFLTMTFIFNAKIGFGRDVVTAETIALILTVLSYFFVRKAYIKFKEKTENEVNSEENKRTVILK